MPAAYIAESVHCFKSGQVLFTLCYLKSHRVFKSPDIRGQGSDLTDKCDFLKIAGHDITYIVLKIALKPNKSN